MILTMNYYFLQYLFIVALALLLEKRDQFNQNIFFIDILKAKIASLSK